MLRIHVIKLTEKIVDRDGLNKNRTKPIEQVVKETNEFIEYVVENGGEIVSITPYRTTNNPSIDTPMIVYKVGGNK